MEDKEVAEVPVYVEHVLVATVAEFVEGVIIEDLLRDLNNAMALLPGVLATHVGRCIPVLGEQTFIMHIRAKDTASCDAAHKAAYGAYVSHLTLHSINILEDFKDVIIVDYESQPIFGKTEKKMDTVNWPAIRFAMMKYKAGKSARAQMASLERTLQILPTLFPLVKQVSWGRNIAKERMYRPQYGCADVDHELGVLLGFSSSQDMEKLGEDPKWCELLNFHGTSVLEKYQFHTLKLN